MNKHVIAVSGKQFAGKDTVVEILLQYLKNFKRIGIGDAIKEEYSKRSERANVTSDCLIQINIGNEETKGGFEYDEGLEAYEKIRAMPALKVKGLMAMLPISDDEALLRDLAKKMRALYEKLRGKDGDIRYLSMGMSGDWKLCMECGSNMVRLGTSIFGPRHYNT